MVHTEHNGSMFYITEFNKGNVTAFSHFYHLFYTRLCYFAEGLIADQTAAEDIVEEVFVKLWNKRGNFETEKNIRAFLFISTKNACLDFLRHERSVEQSREAWQYLAADQEDYVLNRIIESEVITTIYDAIERLPTKCRKIFKMSYLDSMKNQEIATRLGISVNTVKNQKVRALQLLRIQLFKNSAILLIALSCYLSVQDKQ